MQGGIDFAAMEAPLWLRELDLAESPSICERNLRELLSQRAVDVDAPFSTMVVLAIYREVPALVDEQLLESLLLSGSKDGLHFLAFEVLAAAPESVPLSFLQTAIGDPDPRVARQCLRALVAREEGPAEVRAFLSDRSWNVPEALALDMGAILARSGLVRDSALVTRLIGSDSYASQLTALDALTSGAVAEVPSSMSGRLVSLVMEPGTGPGPARERVRMRALNAIAGTPGGSGTLLELAGRDDVSMSDRAEALRLSRGDLVASARAAVALIPLADDASVVVTLARVAARVASQRDPLAAQLRAWIGSHDRLGDVVLNALEASQRPELNELAVAMQ
jgi:hypothetical protein